MTWRDMQTVAAVAALPLVLRADDPIASLVWLGMCGYVAWLWATSTEEAR